MSISTPGSAVRGDSKDLHDEIDRERKRHREYWADVAEYRDYFKGVQADTLTPDQRLQLNGLLRHLFCDNVARVAVTTLVARVRMTRFDVEHESDTVADGVSEYLRELWVKNQVAEFQGTVHEATAHDGNSGVSISWDNESGRPRWQLEPWWDGKSGIFFVYDRLGSVRYAVNEWKERDGKRRVVYYRERIERYRSGSKAQWEPFELEEDEGRWPMPWVDPQTKEPLGIAAVHFRNGRGRHGYGRSDLAGGPLGVQDHINDLHRQILAAARKTGYQILTGTGITLPRNKVTNEPEPLTVEPGDMLTDSNPQASFGAIQPADLRPLIEALREEIQTFARDTDTPLHHITREWPSGMAIYRAEMPQMNKAKRRVDSVGPSWGSLGHRSVRVGNAFGRLGLDPSALVTPVMVPPDAPDPVTVVEVAEKRAGLGVSQRQTYRDLGLSVEEQDRNFQERREEQLQSSPIAQYMAARGGGTIAPPETVRREEG